ncbi:Sjogren's syndrome/scleroderma autoantigen 1 family protein [Halopiger xanaduensis]|uniref:Sjogrens syndrome scleroderma autoantigen 1 n=1 Tax=Halopiger xanaduensis (strain DSM 18323 / JCM 14033 / SH-6) TaxID=797210 RepID=F8D2W8_HALXS|nr:Sjogren's syndrome/scleroderma autoantigen 1 family protein [Halopiger xanaduensis]AEH36111.1 Sjogrens syndrome scleroderma autoantigen 1 [Halopiger xanaduensis SH-6]
MSDFDKEAEREKLREKYERDKAEREATQRMSDLLLKGATMTNTHCGTCGDPLFKQDGTTFCPSCHGNPDAVEGTDLEAQPAEESPGAAGADESAAAATDASAQSIDVESPSDADAAAGTGAAETASTAGTSAEPDRTDSSGTDERDRPASASSERSRESTDRSRRTQQAGNAEEPSESQSRSPATAADRRGQEPAAGAHQADGRRSGSTRRAAASPPVDGDLESARESLVQAVEKFAGEAAATDDPRYAKECLEAAREAGEALSTLR